MCYPNVFLRCKIQLFHYSHCASKIIWSIPQNPFIIPIETFNILYKSANREEHSLRLNKHFNPPPPPVHKTNWLQHNPANQRSNLPQSASISQLESNKWNLLLLGTFYQPTQPATISPAGSSCKIVLQKTFTSCWGSFITVSVWNGLRAGMVRKSQEPRGGNEKG